MHRYDIKTAALLAQASYTAKTNRSIKAKLKDSLDEDDVEAHLLTNGVLLIPGSNSLADYLKYNLRMIRLGKTRYRMSDDIYQEGASGTIWRQGFLAHAKVIYDWVERKNYTPKFIIGHSLGAASTQILSKTWAIAESALPRPAPARPVARSKTTGTASVSIAMTTWCAIYQDHFTTWAVFTAHGEKRLSLDRITGWSITSRSSKNSTNCSCCR